MAAPSTLYRFTIELSDVDRGKYETLDFRVAMHPSETPVYLMTRVLAYALNHDEGLEFTPGGLSDPDAPAIQVRDPGGAFLTWIEIGNPSARKLHRAAKASREVLVYTYKDAERLLEEMRAERVYQAERIAVFSFSKGLLDNLASRLERHNSWSILHNEGSLVVGLGDGASEQGEVRKHPFES